MNKQIGLQTKTIHSLKRKEEIEKAYQINMLELKEIVQMIMMFAILIVIIPMHYMYQVIY